MREGRYTFSDDVRATTRAIALRMIHAGEVAGSPEELNAWIARTDDIRERLTKGGYGSAYTSEDLFPLFQGAVARATNATRSEPVASRGRWVWVAGAVVVVVVIIGLVVATCFSG